MCERRLILTYARALHTLRVYSYKGQPLADSSDPEYIAYTCCTIVLADFVFHRLVLAALLSRPLKPIWQCE